MKSFSKLTLLALLAFSSTLFFSCTREPSDSVDQDKIYTEYELFYNANEDKTYARATFKFSNALGTKLELADGAEVSFGTDVLSWKPGLAYYEKEYVGFVDSGQFTYVDLDGNTFQNDVLLREIGYPVNLDTVSRDSAFDLVWTSSALAADEDVTVTVNGVLEGDAQIFYTNSETATSIILDRDKLGQLGQGSSTFWMDRRSYATHVGTSAGGFVVGRFRAVNANPYLD